MQEYEQVAAKLARRLREPQLVELLAESDLEKKTDFEDKKALEEAGRRPSRRPSSKLEAKIVYDEEHSLYELVSDATARAATRINWALAATPEYKRLRALCAGRSTNATSRRSR